MISRTHSTVLAMALYALTVNSVLVELAGARPLQAQSVQTVKLTTPNAEFKNGFTRISGMRELSDGRVLIGDAGEKSLQLIDFASGRLTKVAAVGEGPGEFGLPGRIYAMRGDTSLLHDNGNGRYMLIHPDGKAGAVISIQGQPQDVRATRGVDAMQRFYFQLGIIPPIGATGGASTEALVRFNRTTMRVDTLANVAIPPGRSQGASVSGLPQGYIRRLDNRPLAEEDVVAIAPDGRVAIVRARDYHVEWIAPNGQRTVGPPIPFERIRVTEAEKQAHNASQVVPGGIITRRNNPDATSAVLPAPVRMPRPGELPQVPGFEDSTLPWPATKPPFLGGAASIAGDGRLWVRRTTVHTDSVPRYDVFDARGQLAARVELPKGHRLVGFGKGTVYLSRNDDQDLNYLRRFAM